ncbi:MAG: MBL fold metallo-hydrolase [Patescibacteria group bacterium]|nr:MBL fold metallo-hydrolase [Patescibacteria group bacterium]
MRWGDVEIYSIEMGRFWLDGGSIFGVVPKTLWNLKYPSDEKNRIELALRSLLIKTNDRNILVDTGIGDNFSPKYREIYGVDFNISNPADSLAVYGLTSADITDIIVTHLHFDHIGGALRNAYTSPEPVYPNAVYYIQEEQWNWAHHPSEKDHGSYIPEFFKQLREKNAVQFVRGEWDFLPFLKLLVFEGHTPFMQLPIISVDGKTLFFGGDLNPLSSQIAVPYIMSFDVNPLKTAEEKKKIAVAAESNHWLHFFQHDTKVEAAYIVKGQKHYQIGDAVRINEM